MFSRPNVAGGDYYDDDDVRTTQFSLALCNWCKVHVPYLYSVLINENTHLHMFVSLSDQLINMDRKQYSPKYKNKSQKNCRPQEETSQEGVR